MKERRPRASGDAASPTTPSFRFTEASRELVRTSPKPVGSRHRRASAAAAKTAEDGCSPICTRKGSSTPRAGDQAGTARRSRDSPQVRGIERRRAPHCSRQVHGRAIASSRSFRSPGWNRDPVPARPRRVARSARRASCDSPLIATGSDDVVLRSTGQFLFERVGGAWRIVSFDVTRRRPVRGRAHDPARGGRDRGGPRLGWWARRPDRSPSSRQRRRTHRACCSDGRTTATSPTPPADERSRSSRSGPGCPAGPEPARLARGLDPRNLPASATATGRRRRHPARLARVHPRPRHDEDQRGVVERWTGTHGADDRAELRSADRLLGRHVVLGDHADGRHGRRAPGPDPLPHAGPILRLELPSRPPASPWPRGPCVRARPKERARRGLRPSGERRARLRRRPRAVPEGVPAEPWTTAGTASPRACGTWTPTSPSTSWSTSRSW